ncbi:uncharacterized protein LOC111029416 [Myzus persicae]|uniref:uncharacterized protein LOC111029416 n=1 Tax=Myzus persicae TaxID=13164 RepID=UPI000B932AB6|nr:uncharacterized protein LOC111029416 [Myzus persicae]
MPKYAFKPSCSLSKKSRIKRQNLSTSTECNIVCTPLTNQEEHLRPINLEVHNSYRITTESLSHADNEHILENVELASIENFPIKTFGVHYFIKNSKKKCHKVIEIAQVCKYIRLFEKLRLYKFVIIEFLNESSTEVVPISWIKIDNTHHQFICQWPEKVNITKYASSQKKPVDTWESFPCCPRKFFNTYSEAKRRLIKFCETSSTETEELLTSKPRVRVPKRKYSSSEEETSVISTLNHQNLSRNVKVTQKTHTEIQKGLMNIPKPKKPIDFFNNDDESLQQTPNILKPKKLIDFFNDNDDENLQINVTEDCIVSSPEMFTEKNTTTDYSQGHDEHIISVYNMLNNIGHAVMDVSKELKTLKKEIHVIKVDVIKNQEILNSLAENVRRTVSSVDTRQAINRASLKIPVQTISELNEIEEDEDKLSTLVNYYS